MATPATTAATNPLTPAESTVRGRFLWYDLMVPDVDAATRFYPAVTGWTSTPWTAGEGMPPYTMWVNGETPVGGVMALSAEQAARGVPPHWVAYVGTPDVDGTYRDALALGARGYVAPTDIPAVGRFAVLADPQGAVFAIFQPASPGAPSAGEPVVGQFSWHELATSDGPAAFDFYAQLFGWVPTEAMDMGPAGVYQLYGQGGTTYGGMFTGTHGGAPPHWLLYVRVADMDRALDAVRGGGGQVLNGPMEVPGGSRIAHCADPQGARFAVHVAAPADGGVARA